MGFYEGIHRQARLAVRRPAVVRDLRFFRAFYRKPGKRWHVARALEWFTNEQEAEADLERWAAKKHMRCMEG